MEALFPHKMGLGLSVTIAEGKITKSVLVKIVNFRGFQHIVGFCALNSRYKVGHMMLRSLSVILKWRKF